MYFCKHSFSTTNAVVQHTAGNFAQYPFLLFYLELCADFLEQFCGPRRSVFHLCFIASCTLKRATTSLQAFISNDSPLLKGTYPSYCGSIMNRHQFLSDQFSVLIIYRSISIQLKCHSILTSRCRLMIHQWKYYVIKSLHELLWYERPMGSHNLITYMRIYIY